MTCADLEGEMGRDSLEKEKINEINFVKFPKIGHRPPSNKIIPQNPPPPLPNRILFLDPCLRCVTMVLQT